MPNLRSASQGLSVLTWNSQGKMKESYLWRLKKYQPDVMLVQECGNLGGVAFPGKADRAVRVWEEGEYVCWWVVWSRQMGGSGNMRCSLAMIFRKDDTGEPVVRSSTSEMKRPVLFKTIKGYGVYNVHAGGIPYIGEVLAMGALTARDKKFVVAGDFNQEAPSMTKLISGSTHAGKMDVVAPTSATRPASNKIIDYAVTNAQGTAEIGVDYQGSDHLHVLIKLT